MVSCQSALICFYNRHLVMYSSSHKTHLEEPDHPWSSLIHTYKNTYILLTLSFVSLIFFTNSLISTPLYFIFLFFIYLFTPLQYPTHLYSAYLHCILPYFTPHKATYFILYIPKLTCQRTLRQVFYVFYLSEASYPPMARYFPSPYTLYTCIQYIYSFTQGRGEGGES